MLEPRKRRRASESVRKYGTRSAALHLLTAHAGGQDKIEAVAKLLLEQEKIDAED
jgi:hypothetical protein